MKKIYLALTCMASLLLMTACGGEKKTDASENENENTEVVEEAAEQSEEGEAGEGAVANPADAQALDLKAIYENGDFKPAEGVFFKDDLSSEKDGELPSKWELKEGSMEVNACAGRNILKLGGSSTCIAPKLNGELPDVWNLEYEYFKTDDANQEIWFFSGEDKLGHIYLYNDYVQYWFTKTNDDSLDGQTENLSKVMKKGWNHVAVSYNKGGVKIYVNGKRTANLPDIKSLKSFSIHGSDGLYITNIRVTK
ncbi:MAG: hypothetical protein IKI16_04505 [Prevotella sp.]|nr:hypothetical protein [Prevotella sp.]